MNAPVVSPPHSNGRGRRWPRIPSDFVRRPRLVDRLEAPAAAPRLTLVCAPAGYGKTVLLAGWLQDSRLPAAWVALRDQDHDLPALCRRLEAALREAFPADFRLADAPHLLAPHEQSEPMAAELERLPGPTVLVLDDYHHVRDEAAHRFLRDLIERMPENLRLVVATREDPPLPLARLRAANEMVEIRARHLRFTESETREFVSGALPGRPPEALVTALEQRAEGWIAGLRLAALAARECDDAAEFACAFDGTAPSIMTYLLDEVLARLPGPAQGLLLCASVLEADGTNVAGVLEQMECGNVLLGADGRDPGWHRIHPLFRDVLRWRLSSTRPAEEIAALHRRASEWLDRQGKVEEAVHHALAAGDEAAAAAVVERHALAAMDREQWPEIRQWLSLLPPPVVDARPLLLLVRAAVGSGWFRLGSMEELLDRAEARLAEELPESGTAFGLLAALRSQEAYLSRQPVRAIEQAWLALRILPYGWTLARETAFFYLALSLQAIGHADEALRTLDTAAEPQGDPPPGFLARLHLARAHVFRAEGKLGAFGHAARSALHHAAAAARSTTEAWAHCWLGHACYERDALEDAARHFRSAFLAGPAAQLMVVHDSLAGLTFSCQAMGRPEQATQTLEEARGLAEEMGPLCAVRLAQSCAIRLALFQGRRGEAQRMLAAAEPVDPYEPEVWFELPALTRARVLIAGRSEGELQEAAALLSGCLDEADREHDAWRALHILPLLSVALDGLGRPREAEAVLERALRTSGADGFLRCFLDAGPRLVPVLQSLGAPGASSASGAERILAAFAASGCTGSDAGAGLDGAARETAGKPKLLAEPLTRREVQVLSLLARRLTDREIADALFISSFTVKRHAASIYGKLRVEGRREAVTRARDLGLIMASD